jgi:hypothetical protein
MVRLARQALSRALPKCTGPRKVNRAGPVGPAYKSAPKESPQLISAETRDDLEEEGITEAANAAQAFGFSGNRGSLSPASWSKTASAGKNEPFKLEATWEPMSPPGAPVGHRCENIQKRPTPLL